MRSSYNTDDVTILLKDLTGLVKPLPALEREKLIQAGKHYSQMLPIEYVPGEKYMEIYEKTLKTSAASVAKAVAVLSAKLVQTFGNKITLVSLARAGTPIGILLRRFLMKEYGLDCPHFTISIIRDKGIDKNAMKYILARHNPSSLVFVDGWVGKGAILKELKSALAEFPDVSDEIAVLADPAYVTELCGTHEDILIPSACLNSTICGLISRTYLDESVIGEQDFHGAVFYGEFSDSDRSNSFLDAIEAEFGERADNAGVGFDCGSNSQALCLDSVCSKLSERKNSGYLETSEIAKAFNIDNINMVKPGIGETTRVLLRRVPFKILIDERYENEPELEHVLQLAKEKNVEVEHYPLKHYKCCGIIKKLSDI